MDDAENITLELLSAHHSMDNFDSGDVESNLLAANLLARVRDRDADDFVAVVAADKRTHEVAGIAATTDLVLVAAGPDGEEISGKCLFYYLLAVSRDARVHGVLCMLLEEFDRIRARRLARGDYVGEVAAPLRGKAAEENSLMRYVERAGFRSLGSGNSLWFRPSPDE
jgi:hypothetical protein